MTHPMVEKAAQALFESSSIENGGSTHGDWNAIGEVQKDVCRKSVIAVLRTLREPDETMLDAGQSAYCGYSSIYEYGIDNEDMAQAFTAMIDSILPTEDQA